MARPPDGFFPFYHIPASFSTAFCTGLKDHKKTGAPVGAPMASKAIKEERK
jgi:hypothetical protein